MQNAKCKIAIKNSKLTLFAILFVGIILRLINLQEWTHFEMDEEVIAWKVREFVLTGKPFLIGGGTPYGFHVGPAFYYLSALPLFFSKLDPAVWGIWAAVFGGAAIFVAYKAGKVLYDRKTGLIMALFWAISFVQIFSDRHWWPMVLNPLLGLLSVWSWREIIAGKGKKWWLILGAVLAFAWQADLSNLILFLGTGAVVLILLVKRNLGKNIPGILGCLGILGISFTPLIFFETRHPGANLGKFLEYKPAVREINIKKVAESLALPVQVSGNLIAPAIYSDGNLLKFYSWDRTAVAERTAGQSWPVTAAGLGLLVWPIIMWIINKRSADSAVSVLILSGCTGILIFGLAGGDLYDFYLTALYPAVLISGATLLSRMVKRRGIFGVLGMLGVLGILGINWGIYAKAYHPQGLKVKKEAVEWSISQTGDSSFGLDVLSRSNRYNGMRYLYMLYGKEPAVSYMDESISWLYDVRGSADPTKFVVISTVGDLTPYQKEKMDVLVGDSEKRERIGAFDIMILNNGVKNYQIN